MTPSQPTWTASPPEGCHRLRRPSPFIIIYVCRCREVSWRSSTELQLAADVHAVPGRRPRRRPGVDRRPGAGGRRPLGQRARLRTGQPEPGPHQPPLPLPSQRTPLTPVDAEAQHRRLRASPGQSHRHHDTRRFLRTRYKSSDDERFCC